MNPKSTLNDHIVDHVGFETTYAAYQEHVEKNGAEPLLPGLHYTPNQLFWISAARQACLVIRREYFRQDYEFNPPDEYTANGPVRNSKRFSDDFNCKVGSPMNPANKCKIW